MAKSSSVSMFEGAQCAADVICVGILVLLVR